MFLNKMETVVSTYKNGRPTKRLLFNTLFYFIIAIVMFYAFNLFYTDDYQTNSYSFFQPDYSILKYVSLMFLFFGFILIIAGILNLLPETVKIDNYGVTIIKRKKTKEIRWSDISELISTKGLYVGYNHARSYPVIVIKSLHRKHKIRSGNLSFYDLKKIFLYIAEHSNAAHIKIVDILDWLPKESRYNESKISGISVLIREYQILLKLGTYMLLPGISLTLIAVFQNSYNSAWFGIGVMSLFFAIMFILTGKLGIGEENQKLEKIS